MAVALKSNSGVFVKLAQRARGFSLRPNCNLTLCRTSWSDGIPVESGSNPELRTFSELGWQSLYLARSLSPHLSPLNVRKYFCGLHFRQDQTPSVCQITLKQPRTIRKVQDNDKVLSHKGKDIFDLERNKHVGILGLLEIVTR